MAGDHRSCGAVGRIEAETDASVACDSASSVPHEALEVPEKNQNMVSWLKNILSEPAPKLYHPDLGGCSGSGYNVNPEICKLRWKPGERLAPCLTSTRSIRGCLPISAFCPASLCHCQTTELHLIYLHYIRPFETFELVVV